MITFIKLLVLLFLSILGYDTVNLFLQNTSKKNEVTDLAITRNKQPICLIPPILNEKYTTRGVLYVGIISFSIIVITVLLFKRRRSEQENRRVEILTHLRTLPVHPKTGHDKFNVLTADDNKYQLEEDSKNNLLDEDSEDSVINDQSEDSKSSACDDERDDQYVVENTIAAMPVIVLPPSVPINPIEMFANSPANRLDNDTLNDLIFRQNPPNNFMLFNDSNQILYGDAVQMRYELPSAQDQLFNNCNCKILDFEERLEEVENDLKSTKQVTVLWRHRIEQTEEELLELQQQLSRLLLESASKNYQNIANLRNKNLQEDFSITLPTLNEYRQLQTISDIIEDIKNQIEEEDKLEQKQNDEKMEEDLVKTAPNEDDYNVSVSHELEGKNCTDSTEDQKEDEENSSEIESNFEDDKFLCEIEPIKLEKDEVILLTEKNTDSMDTQSEKSSSPREFKSEEKMAEEKLLLLQRNEELKLKTLNLVREVEGVMEVNQDRYNKIIMHKVPSHVVSPRQTLYTKKKRPPPRCAYSVLTDSVKY